MQMTLYFDYFLYYFLKKLIKNLILKIIYNSPGFNFDFTFLSV